MFSKTNYKTKYSYLMESHPVKVFFFMNSGISSQFVGVISKETVKWPYFSTNLLKQIWVHECRRYIAIWDWNPTIE